MLQITKKPCMIALTCGKQSYRDKIQPAPLHGAPVSSTAPNHACHAQADIGPVHNIFLSPYEDFRPGSDQYDWFLNDLISIDRTLTPWVTLNVHNPWCAPAAGLRILRVKLPKTLNRNSQEQ